MENGLNPLLLANLACCLSGFVDLVSVGSESMLKKVCSFAGHNSNIGFPVSRHGEGLAVWNFCVGMNVLGLAYIALALHDHYLPYTIHVISTIPLAPRYHNHLPFL